MSPRLLACNKPQQKGHGVAVKVEENETSISTNILTREVAQQIGLALAGLPKNGQMLWSFSLRNRYMTTRDPFVDHGNSQVKGASQRADGSRNRETIPGTGKDVFDKFHACA